MSQIDQSRVAAIAEALVGTCMTDIDDVTTPEERNDVEFLRAVDAVVFRCECCDWWCDTSEMDDGEELTICRQCAEEAE